MPWSATAIAAELRVTVVRDMPALSAATEATVGAAWQATLAANPSLFNGRIFSADQVSPHRIEGHWTEYRRAVAQMQQPALAATLRLRPTAVCGVLICRQFGERAVLFGRRSPRTSYQQGLWQLPPAGSVDFKAARPDGSVDIHGALLTELREEVGLPADAIRASAPLCAVEHPGSRVLDLGFALITELPADAVLAAHATSGDLEYPETRIVRFSDLDATLQCWGDQVVPSAALFLKQAVALF